MVKPAAILRLLLLLLPAGLLQAQVHCFVQTQMDRQSVYAQQPFKVTFTVYTATWFTAPLDFDNIQIPDAFILPFDRTQPGMFTRSGKQYAGIQFYFIVFPYKAGKFTIPAIRIVAQTPPEGQSTSKKITLASAPQSFIVKPNPPSFTGADWFVAKNVFISEDWDKSLSHLKVGDVVKRTVTINAKGTLPQFIPAAARDTLDWASTYIADAVLEDTRDDYDANGIRKQTFTYLLEKEGAFRFPAKTITWWNPYSGKVYRKTTGVVNVQVQPNPNLGILTTLKDSLNAGVTQAPVAAVHKGPLQIMGMPWYWFACIAAGAVLLLYWLVLLLLRLYRWAVQWRKRVLQSEAHWFRKLLLSPLQLPVLLRNLYHWWDRSGINREAAFTSTLPAAEQQLQQEMHTYFHEVYHNNTVAAKAGTAFKKRLRHYRKAQRKTCTETKQVIALQQQLWPDA
ncbi:BatD family protein [Deminuibacter soli]|uniref:Protein BatD n=1 Tax=Deminuibacter soli TaxID=2291815 RepID=A0A3E1NHH9_9BACT|nr:BatD family protein [Deminuibacter soli]RFM27311.1 hypothetical protein DXN05_14885 [Deminuibacter soli]